MRAFDKIIMEGMVNTESMLKARLVALKKKRSAGFDVTAEIKRAGRFLERYQSFTRDWQYWYYDDLPGKGDPGPKEDKPDLEAIYAGIEVRIQKRMYDSVLPQANEIELVLDKVEKKS